VLSCRDRQIPHCNVHFVRARRDLIDRRNNINRNAARTPIAPFDRVHLYSRICEVGDDSFLIRQEPVAKPDAQISTRRQVAGFDLLLNGEYDNPFDNAQLTIRNSKLPVCKNHQHTGS